jgi:hypothetical protein
MANSVMDLKKEIIRLRVALADTEALEIGTGERLEKVTAQLESEKLSHAAWEKQSLLEYSELTAENQQLRDALVTIGDARPGSISFLDLQAFARNVLKGIEK